MSAPVNPRLSPALLDLIDLGFEALRCPHDGGVPSRVQALADTIAHLSNQYPTQSHFLAGAEILIQGLHQLVLLRRADPAQTAAWEALCGAAIAITRAQAWQSILWEKEYLQ